MLTLSTLRDVNANHRFLKRFLNFFDFFSGKILCVYCQLLVVKVFINIFILYDRIVRLVLVKWFCATVALYVKRNSGSEELNLASLLCVIIYLFNSFFSDIRSCPNILTPVCH